MMKLATWNIRGLNAGCKHTDVKKLIFEEQLDLLCIVETKVRWRNVDRVKRLCIPNWELIHNTTANSVGRVWITWNNDKLNVQVLKINT